MNGQIEDSSADLALVAKGDGGVEETISAIERLHGSPIADVRAIAAQGCVKCPGCSFTWMLNWLDIEPDYEARGWLYIALAINYREKSKKYLSSFIKNIDKMEDYERLYLNAALSISYSSRIYFLKVLEFIFNKDQAVSLNAENLAKMLVNDDVSLSFIDIFSDEAKSSAASVG